MVYGTIRMWFRCDQDRLNYITREIWAQYLVTGVGVGKYQ
jgi:hypothetical protein